MATKDEEPLTMAVMVRDLVRRAEEKLVELQSRKGHIRRRLQALRYLVTHSASTRSARQEKPALAPSISRTEVSPVTPAPGPEIPQESDKLRRACRIALMESDQPQGCREIFRRIKHRGSLSFDGYPDPLQALTNELDLMTAQEEITCVSNRGEKRWQRRLCD